MSVLFRADVHTRHPRSWQTPSSSSSFSIFPSPVDGPIVFGRKFAQHRAHGRFSGEAGHRNPTFDSRLPTASDYSRRRRPPRNLSDSRTLLFLLLLQRISDVFDDRFGRMMMMMMLTILSRLADVGSVGGDAVDDPNVHFGCGFGPS